MRLQQIRKVAFMFRGKMNNYYKRQTAVRRHLVKELLKRREAAGGSSDADDSRSRFR